MKITWHRFHRHIQQSCVPSIQHWQTLIPRFFFLSKIPSWNPSISWGSGILIRVSFSVLFFPFGVACRTLCGILRLLVYLDFRKQKCGVFIGDDGTQEGRNAKRSFETSNFKKVEWNISGISSSSSSATDDLIIDFISARMEQAISVFEAFWQGALPPFFRVVKCRASFSGSVFCFLPDRFLTQFFVCSSCSRQLVVVCNLRVVCGTMCVRSVASVCYDFLTALLKGDFGREGEEKMRFWCFAASCSEREM